MDSSRPLGPQTRSAFGRPEVQPPAHSDERCGEHDDYDAPVEVSVQDLADRVPTVLLRHHDVHEDDASKPLLKGLYALVGPSGLC